VSVSFVRTTANRLTGGGISGMTLGISASAGQFVVVEGYPSGGSSSVPVSSITDNGGGNTWALPGNYTASNPPAIYTGGSGCFLAYCNVAHSLSSVTVNIPTASELTVCVSVYNGVKTSFPWRQDTTGLGQGLTLSVLGGGLCVGGANTSSATAIGGLATLTTLHNNLAGYGLAGPNENVTFNWGPSQNAPAVFAEFLAASTITTIHGTATLHDFESMNPDALSSIAATSSMTESEMLSAISGANPHVAFSAITPDQNDSNGIPLIHGLTSYHYPLTTSVTYDYWMSIQDGQLGAGLYGAARNSGLTVSSSVPKWTDSGSNTLGMVRSYGADASSNLASFTTEADVPGATVSVVVTGSNATVVVYGQFDFSSQAPSTNITFIGFLNWNGSDRSQQAVFEAGAVTARSCCARSWRITGVTAGTYVAKLRASCSVNSANNVVNVSHTGLTAIVIDM